MHAATDAKQKIRLYVESPSRRPPPATTIVTAPRVGIAYAEEWQHEPLRFFVAGNPHVSPAHR